MQPCDNPTCSAAADYAVTVMYPRGDVEGVLCEKHTVAGEARNAVIVEYKL